MSKTCACALAGLALLAACSGTGANYDPIIDGPKTDRYYSDLSQCQDLARQKSVVGGNTALNTLGGAAVGAVTGALIDGGSGAATGAAVGGAGAAGGSVYSNHRERERIVRNCLSGRGYRVLE